MLLNVSTNIWRYNLPFWRRILVIVVFIPWSATCACCNHRYTISMLLKLVFQDGVVGCSARWYDCGCVYSSSQNVFSSSAILNQHTSIPAITSPHTLWKQPKLLTKDIGFKIYANKFTTDYGLETCISHFIQLFSLPLDDLIHFVVVVVVVVLFLTVADTK